MRTRKEQQLLPLEDEPGTQQPSASAPAADDYGGCHELH